MASIDKHSYAHMFGPDCMGGDRVHEVGKPHTHFKPHTHLSVEILGER